MATAKSIDTNDYKLFPSPRNVHRVIFEHQVFVIIRVKFTIVWPQE